MQINELYTNAPVELKEQLMEATNSEWSETMNLGDALADLGLEQYADQNV